MSDYLAAATGLGITASVHVEADVDERFAIAETEWLLSLVALADNPLVALVIRASPESGDFRKIIERFADNPAVRGVRRVLHTQPDDLLSDAQVIENIRSVSKFGLTFDLCVRANQLSAAYDLVSACPQVQFILDHCGVPDIQAGAIDPWRADLKRISQLPNLIAVKISGLVAYTGTTRWTPDQLRPYVDHAVQCFGHRRILFGSDWPVCTLASTLSRWVTSAIEMTQDWSADDRDAFFAGNARRVYRLHPILGA